MTDPSQSTESSFTETDSTATDGLMRPSIAVSLRTLFPHASLVGCADLCVRNAVCTSHQVTAGSLFAALPGTVRHGREFISDAMARGATSLLVEQPIAECLLPQCVVPNVRDAYARLCHAIFGDPTRHLGVVGITGTNGKTTTTWMVRSILEAARGPSGLIGTIETSDGIGRAPAQLTTPGSRELAMLLAATRRNQVRYAALEMSSHALDQCRTAGTRLDVAVVTNLTQDHFDYHGSFENYRAAKARIFSHVKRGGAVVLNADDSRVLALREEVASIVVTFGLRADADVQGELLDSSDAGTHFRVTAGHEQATFFTPLIGEYNVSNALAAIASARQLGLPLAAMVPGMERLLCVPGRMQRVDAGQSYGVWVDYAHTDDGLQRALNALRPLIPGRLIVVFGAGGDRDPGKRALMGRAATAADVAVITSDNPRSESPQSIAEAIQLGWNRSDRPLVILDREEAIRHAIHSAGPGDGILIAGKGHEQEQIAAGKIRRFCDVEVARQAIESHPQRRIDWPAAPHLLKSRIPGKVSQAD